MFKFAFNRIELLHMGAQFKLHWMGIKIGLLFEVWLVVLAHVVVDQSDRHDQGDQLFAIVVEYFEKFLFLIRSQLSFKISHKVLQHIGVLPDGCFQSQGFHQQQLIVGIQLLDRQFFALCDQFSHHAVVLLAVGQEQKFVAGMKINQLAHAAPAG